MNEGQEKLQRKIGKRPGLFWLLFAVASCGWLIVSVTLHAEDNRTVADMNTCVDIAKSGFQNDIDGAIAKITPIIESDPRVAYVCIQLRADLYAKKGNLNQAIIDASRAIELSPKELGAYDLRASLYVMAQRWDLALADCTVVLAKAKMDTNCLVNRETALYKLNRYADALEASDVVLKVENKLNSDQKEKAYQFRGYSQFYLNNYPEAISSLNQAVTLGDTDVWAYMIRGVAEWKLGQFDKAKSDAAVVLQLDAEKQVRFAGDHLLDLFDLDKRRTATMNAIDAAQAAEVKGDWPAAFEAWNTAYSYGSRLLQDGPATLAKVQEGMIRTYAKLAVKPALPEIGRQFQKQAESYFQEKNYLKAAEAYGNLINVAPWFAPAWFNQGLLAGELQQYKAAITDMQMYLKLAPDAQDARAAQDQIYAWQAKAK